MTMKTVDRPTPSKTPKASPKRRAAVAKATKGGKSSRNRSLTERLTSSLANSASSPEFDLHAETNEVLKDIGLTTADAGGKLTFYGPDPILPTPIPLRTLPAVSLASKRLALPPL